MAGRAGSQGFAIELDADIIDLTSEIISPYKRRKPSGPDVVNLVADPIEASDTDKVAATDLVNSSNEEDVVSCVQPQAVTNVPESVAARAKDADAGGAEFGLGIVGPSNEFQAPLLFANRPKARAALFTTVAACNNPLSAVKNQPASWSVFGHHPVAELGTEPVAAPVTAPLAPEAQLTGGAAMSAHLSPPSDGSDEESSSRKSSTGAVQGLGAATETPGRSAAVGAPVVDLVSADISTLGTMGRLPGSAPGSPDTRTAVSQSPGDSGSAVVLGGSASDMGGTTITDLGDPASAGAGEVTSPDRGAPLGSAAGSPSTALGRQTPMKRMAAQRLEPMLGGKNHNITRVGCSNKEDVAQVLDPLALVKPTLRRKSCQGLGGSIKSNIKFKKVKGGARGKRPVSAPVATEAVGLGSQAVVPRRIPRWRPATTEAAAAAEQGTAPDAAAAAAAGDVPLDVAGPAAAAAASEERLAHIVAAVKKECMQREVTLQQATVQVDEAVPWVEPKMPALAVEANAPEQEVQAEAPKEAVDVEAEAAAEAEAVPDAVPAIRVILSEEDLDTDDELVEEIYSEEVHDMMQEFLESGARLSRRDLQLLDISGKDVTFPNEEARTAALDAVKQYLALPPEAKLAYMKERVEVFVIKDMRHHAKKLHNNVLRHLNIRDEERGVKAVRDLPAFCLMGEYVGVLTTGDAAEKATEHCPLGFGGLRNDKLKDLSHSRQQHSSDFIGLWTEGRDLVVDPAKAGNMLRYVNDVECLGGRRAKNVEMVEFFDHNTLRPHSFFFTVAPVRAGRELLLDYGNEFRRFMKSETKRAKSLVDGMKEIEELKKKLEKCREDNRKLRKFVKDAGIPGNNKNSEY